MRNNERLAKRATPLPAREGAAEMSRRGLAAAWRLAISWKEPLALFVGWRLGLGALAFLAALLVPALERGGTAPFTPANLGPLTERLLGVWSHWDGEWFLYVAQVGYRPGDFTSPFFPLYPVLVRGLATVLLGNYLLAGVLLSALFSLACFILIYLLASHESGEPVGRRAALYLAIFPTSFFLAATYSESLFLALTLGAFLAARRYANWWLAGLLVGLAAVTRNIGILLLLPLGWEWLRQQRHSLVTVAGKGWRFDLFRQRVDWRASLAFVFLPLLFLAGWLAAQAVVLKDPLNFMTVQNNPVWNRHSAWPWQAVGRAFELFFSKLNLTVLNRSYREDPNLLDLLFWVFVALAFVMVAYLAWRRLLAGAYLIYFALAGLLPLFSPANNEPLLSYPRFALLLFPIFMGLAVLGERWRVLHYFYLFGSAFLLALLFARFANWYWVA